VHADRFGQVAVTGFVLCHEFAHDRKYFKRIEIIERCERFPYLGKFQHQQAPTGTQYAVHFRQRGIFMRHVAQPKGDGDDIEIIAGEWQLLAIALRGERREALIQHAVAAYTQHGAVDVGEHDLATGADPFGKGAGQIGRAARHVQYTIARAHRALLNGERLPQAVHAGRHQVVHHVVAIGDRVEYLRHFARFFLLLDLLIAEMSGHGVYFDFGRCSNAAGMAEVGSRLASASFMRAK